uniref:Uncharacterized protein n=1 Tax=Acrobeloides nanus TaxID=290746 RepID=A0A914CZN7_9BILA
MIILNQILGYDLTKLAKKSKNSTFASTSAKKEASQLLEASRLSFGILICGIIFIMFPSALVGIMEMAGFAVFKSFGPFYILGLLLAGLRGECEIKYIDTKPLKIKQKIQIFSLYKESRVLDR